MDQLFLSRSTLDSNLNPTFPEEDGVLPLHESSSRLTLYRLGLQHLDVFYHVDPSLPDVRLIIIHHESEAACRIYFFYLVDIVVELISLLFTHLLVGRKVVLHAV